jgi:ribosome-associated protein
LNSIEETTLKSLGTVADSIIDKKGEDILIYDVREKSSLTQFFVICTGTNVRQNQAIIGEIDDRLRKIGEKPLHGESSSDSGWTLIDYGYMIIHVFLPETREFYDLEGLWGDAEKISPDELAKYAA